MSEYVLLAARSPGAREWSPTGVARQLVTATAWCGALRRWGLLRGYALRRGGGADPQSCLVVRASGPAAALRLASGWEQAAGYAVTTLPLIDAAAVTTPSEATRRPCSGGGGR